MADILNASDQEVLRLLKAFRSIQAMQSRMRVLDLAEKLAREKPSSYLVSQSRGASEDSNVIDLRRLQSLDDQAECA